VCTVTGHGLKDPERAVAVSNTVEKVEADSRVLRKVILE
jgi:threonine synthase